MSALQLAMREINRDDPITHPFCRELGARRCTRIEKEVDAVPPLAKAISP